MKERLEEFIGNVAIIIYEYMTSPETRDHTQILGEDP